MDARGGEVCRALVHFLVLVVGELSGRNLVVQVNGVAVIAEMKWNSRQRTPEVGAGMAVVGNPTIAVGESDKVGEGTKACH